MNTIEKGFKYRMYPKQNQIEQLELMFKAKRYVWNYFLNINKHRLNHQKRVYNFYGFEKNTRDFSRGRFKIYYKLWYYKRVVRLH